MEWVSSRSARIAAIQACWLRVLHQPRVTYPRLGRDENEIDVGEFENAWLGARCPEDAHLAAELDELHVRHLLAVARGTVAAGQVDS